MGLLEETLLRRLHADLGKLFGDARLDFLRHLEVGVARGHVALSMTYDEKGRVASRMDARGLRTGVRSTFSYLDTADGLTTTQLWQPPVGWAQSVPATGVKATANWPSFKTPTTTSSWMELPQANAGPVRN